ETMQGTEISLAQTRLLQQHVDGRRWQPEMADPMSFNRIQYRAWRKRRQDHHSCAESEERHRGRARRMRHRRGYQIGWRRNDGENGQEVRRHGLPCKRAEFDSLGQASRSAGTIDADDRVRVLM